MADAPAAIAAASDAERRQLTVMFCDLVGSTALSTAMDAVAWLIEVAEGTPVLMAWEDLHWADPTTLETLGMLIEQAPTAALLVVATYRPELTPPWPQRSHMTPITLNRLERPEVETMVGHLAGGRPLPGEVVDHIVAKADGVPLYVEELTKAILGSGVLEARGDAYVLTGALAQLHIPETAGFADGAARSGAAAA